MGPGQLLLMIAKQDTGAALSGKEIRALKMRTETVRTLSECEGNTTTR